MAGTMRAAHGSPLIVNADGSTEALERIPFEQDVSDATRYDEAWLQKVIFQNPEVLPVTEIDRSFAPALPVAREVPTAAGSIDVVLASPTGYVTLIETKLWRNPEARRTVVGQIIEYAKEFAKWTPGDLESALKRSLGYAATGDLYTYLQRDSRDVSQQDFSDTLALNLERGRLLLLLVGDGIRESVQEIAEYLQRFAQLQFTLGLVDLAVYQRNDGSRLLVPRVVSRTREVTRAVIRIEGVGAGIVAHVDASPETERGTSGSERFTLNEGDFMSQLERESGPAARAIVVEILDFMREVELVADFKQSSFTARLPNPAGGSAFSLFNVDTNGTIVFGYLRTQLERHGLPLQVQEKYANTVAREFRVATDKWGYPNSVSFKKFRENPAALKAAVIEVVAALRTTEA